VSSGERTETQAPAAVRSRAAPRDALFVVLQCRRPAAAPACIKIDQGATIELGRGTVFAVVARSDGVRVEIPDPVMSSLHARIQPLVGGVVIEDAGSKNGTRIDGVPQKSAPLRDGTWIETGDTLLRYRQGVLAGSDPLVQYAAGDDLATVVPELAARFAELATIAIAQLPILVLGETGTGKEIVARAVHRLAHRTGAFVAVNCGAIPATLVESELFGHKRGGFSGAHDDRAGLVRSADRGTLFLDEIGELPAPAQAALLRVLQEHEVVPVGGDRPIPVDLRVVAATHRDLEAAVATGGFREDLYGRLAGQIVRLPPLRERLEDLGLLLARLLARHATSDVTIELDTARALVRHRWPRNVRELEMTLLAMLAADPRCLRAPAGFAAAPVLRDDEADRKRQLEDLLVQHRGNVSHVAKAMGKARSLVQKWLERYGIDAARYRT
jgi:transcriptional regulator with PAS, ATPase and Fis domain